MSYTEGTPFDSIESAHQFVDLLLEAVEEARQEVEGDITTAAKAGAERRNEALHLVAHKLAALSTHISKSRRLLNDLRTLRRLLLEERKLEAATSRPATARAAGPSH